MSRIAYVNGRYLPFRDAKVHVEDRGYQFADAVYEVCEVRGGRLIDERRHMTRLQRSLSELRIRMPMSVAALGIILREVVAKNRIGYGVVYLQITRGVARRDPAFPPPQTRPNLVVTARPLNRARNEAAGRKGHRGRQRARQSLGPRRHQDRWAIAERSGASGGARPRRARHLVRR